MKTLVPFLIAGAIAAVIAVVAAMLPVVSRPVFVTYIIVTMLISAAYDYRRGRPGHHLF